VVVLRKRVAGVTEAALARFVRQASRAAGLKGAVNVRVTSNSELRSLNRRFRGKNTPTDVLSFPAEGDGSGGFAGDIAISAEMASRNARLLGHAAALEIKVLVLHGILHLRGYDHDHDQGQMAKIEHRLRRELRLPVGLIERAESSEVDARAAAGVRRRS
jgi:probable rRNA maturation factor